MNYKLDQLQQEHRPWVLHNFHQQTIENAYAPLLGIIEEIGELTIASNKEAIKDAIGDIIIFMSDYLSCIGKIFSNVDGTNEQNCCSSAYWLSSESLLILIGELCHAHLKMIQNIRGPKEEHLLTICECLRGIIQHLRACVEEIDIGLTLEKVSQQIWNEVQKRDWKINNITGSIQ